MAACGLHALVGPSGWAACLRAESEGSRIARPEEATMVLYTTKQDFVGQYFRGGLPKGRELRLTTNLQPLTAPFDIYRRWNFGA